MFSPLICVAAASRQMDSLNFLTESGIFNEVENQLMEKENKAFENKKAAEMRRSEKKAEKKTVEKAPSAQKKPSEKKAKPIAPNVNTKKISDFFAKNS